MVVPRLIITTQPPAEWYKDEGDKHFTFNVALQGPVTDALFGQHDRIGLSVRVYYDKGKLCEDQVGLLEIIPVAPVMDLKEKHCTLRCRIKEVSSRHRHQLFVLKIGVPSVPDVEEVTTDPIRVLSKQNKHKPAPAAAATAKKRKTPGADSTDLASADPVGVAFDVLRQLEWMPIGFDDSVLQCASCMAVFMPNSNARKHSSTCKLAFALAAVSENPVEVLLPPVAKIARSGGDAGAAAVVLPPGNPLLMPSLSNMEMPEGPPQMLPSLSALEAYDNVEPPKKVERGFSMGGFGMVPAMLTRSLSWGRSGSSNDL